MASQDRTGELCPFCGKGKLYPAGRREVLEPVTRPVSGEYHREFTEYECDSCHKKTGAHGIGLGAGISVVGTAVVKDLKDRPQDKK